MPKLLKSIVLLFSALLLIAPVVYSQKDARVENAPDSLQYDEFINVVNSTLSDYYKDFSSNKKQTDSIIDAFGYDDKSVPTFPDSIYCLRLKELDEHTPFPLDCNDVSLNVIKFFAQHRRHFTSVALGRSKLYFSMIETTLAKYHLPLELKYLAVIESGLRPTAESNAGALGLWQFMYRTGKMLGLDETSYRDQRMDPEKATDAACRYLKKLYGLYGNWDLVLAAYNAGPGNVNKAIRRSGGYTDYWKIRSFLPRETQGYVPNFIAMAYMMNYHAAHNVRPREPKYYDFNVDTVCLTGSLHMEVIDSMLDWPISEIKELNPVFKTDFIPHTNPAQCLTIPKNKIDNWIALEDTIYKVDSLIYKKIEEQQEVTEPTMIVHYVRRGQTLSEIADRYGTSVRKVMDWNNMHSTHLRIGERLKIYLKGHPASSSTASSREGNLIIHRVRSGQTLGQIAERYNTSVSKIKRWNSLHSSRIDIGQKLKIYTAHAPSSKKEDPKIVKSGEKVIYTIREGDNLWLIANQQGTTVDTLLRLNPGVDYKDLKVGQQIRIQ